MTAFEYASGLISIVIGLGIARVLGGIGQFVDLRKRQFHDWITAGWCAGVLVNLVGWWMNGWMYLRDDQIQLASLLYWLANTCVLYLATYTLVSNVEGDHPGPPAPALAFLTAHWWVHGVWLLADGAWVWHPVTSFAGGVLLLAGIWLRRPLGRALHLAAFLMVLAVAMPTILPQIR